MNQDRGQAVLKVVGYVLFAILVIITLYPLIQAVMISIKTMSDFTYNPTGLPSSINFGNYIDAWNKGNFGGLFINSIIVTVSTILLTIFLVSPAAFALAKLKLKGAKIIYNYFILGMVVPVQVILIPLMKFGSAIKLSNSLIYLILIFTATGMSFPLLVYTSFYKGIPNEIIEAAQIDGCNIFNLFIKIIFPITAAINSTVAILAGMYPWKDYFIPMVFGNSDKVRTLTVGLAKFSGSYFTEWTTVFAALIIQSLPLIILFILLQKNFISGVTSGAVKG